ncbi:four-domain proteases inhibitor-like [Procambarus clarkii]|uniref:four-domain proteases inhibitor-like n=1 Tax=Procambarus clarkii TaxID=6728 RepID=UPI0037440626
MGSLAFTSALLLLLLVACGPLVSAKRPRPRCSDVCTADYRPVCGTDGHTYTNSCALQIKACNNPQLKLKVAYEGSCRPANQCPGACPYNYDPVCGTDGKTYGNACGLGVEACKFPHLNLKVDYKGECR